MDIILEPKDVTDAYSTPIVQQTSFWSLVKERLGLRSCAFEFKVRNIFYQHLNREDYVAYVPYGPEIEPSESNQGTFLEELSESLKSYPP